MSELQASAGVVNDLSPAWIMAAAKHFALRLDTLLHLFLLQPQLATDLSQQGSEKEPQEMVRRTSWLLSEHRHHDTVNVVGFAARWRTSWFWVCVPSRPNC